MIKKLLFAIALLLTPLSAVAQTITSHAGCSAGIVCQASAFVPLGTTIPVAGIYSTGLGGIAVSTASTLRFSISSTGGVIFVNNVQGNAAASYLLAPTTASATAPTFIPNKVSLSTGIGAQAAGNISLITNGAERVRITDSGISYIGTIPTVTGTGTPTITAGSTDSSGEITGGALATSIVISFSTTKTNAPFCVVTPQTQVAAFAYSISTTAITITLTATTGESIDYHCTQH